MGTNYSEQIFQSIDTIVSQRLNEVSFDKTEICEIISIDKKIMNKYLVSNGSLKYEAYSDDEDRKYLVGSKVYVRIANGDYTLRKIITGSYTTDEIPKNLYTNPFNHLVVSSKYNWITETNKLSAIAYKDKITDQAVYLSNDLTFYYSGLGQFNYIGLEFSATTGFGGTTGEFQIIIDLLDNNGDSLLTDEQLGLLTLSSKQLYGNPYYLNSNLKFQHLFNFPVGNFSDLTKVKKIKITLFTKGDFNYEGRLSPITINNLTMYFGFDSSENEMSENKVALVLDNTRSLEYTTANDKKQMSIDWRDLNSGAIYNETPNMQYPEAGKYNIYWLQYSESIGYAKKLEADGGLDIEESGTYWKTVKRTDAAIADAYIYTLSPSADWKKEQIKVIIKKVGTNDYVESNGLTFTNTEFRTETGSNKGKADTLRLTLSEGDDGIYNSYGIDNRLLTSYNLTHSLTVDYVDNNKWDWNPSIQKVIWKIPAKATMIKYPGDDWRLENNFYIYDSNPDLKIINFNLSEQFSYNKTNNTIYCEIIRYKYPNSTEIENDEYQGSITLQFGLQGTAGTGWAFNIVADRRAMDYPEATMNLTATLEDSEGNPIDIDNWKNKVTWSWHQSTNFSDNEPIYVLSQNDPENKQKATIRRIEERGIDPYAIVKATLNDWQIVNGTKVKLEAYMPIAAGDSSYYLTGASRVVYNSNGTNPSYDASKYWLSTDTDKDNPYTYTLVIPDNKKRNQCFSIDEKEGNLKPLSFIPTEPPKMAIYARDSNGVLIYVQPILVLRNQYQSKLINEWNGKLNVDTENNTILSALIGAGKKNENNTFTGVILGVANNFKLGARTGLYGYQDGEVRFALDENGALFIGKGNDNFISFNEGVAGRASPGELLIKTQKFILNAGKLSINSTVSGSNAVINFNDKFILRASGAATIGGWNVETDIMYKSPHRNSSGDIDNPGTGLAASGWSGNPAFWAGYTGAGNNPWEHASNRTDESGWTEHTKCYITNSGILHAKGAFIEGKSQISADSVLDGKTIAEINESVFTTLPQQINAKVSETKNGITNGTGWSLKSDKFEIYSVNNSASTTVLTVNKNGLSVTGAITATSLSLGSGVTIPYNNISGKPDLTIYISKGGTIGTVGDGSTGFTVSTNGLLQASNAIIYGTIYSSEGKIANWDIKSDYLGSYGDVANTIFMSKGKAAYVNQTGTSPSCVFYSKGNFAVTTDGKLYAASGKIAGWTIESNSISNDKMKLTSSTSGGTFSVGNIFSINNNGQILFNKEGWGFFTLGKTNYPYAAALNLACNAGGLVWTNGTSYTDTSSNLSALATVNMKVDAKNNYENWVWENKTCSTNFKFNNFACDDISDEYFRFCTGNGTAWTINGNYHNPWYKFKSLINPGSMYFYAKESITLHAKNGKVYVGNGANENKPVQTADSGMSSLNLKNNIIKFNNKDYTQALELLEAINLYNYEYKFNNLHPKKEQFGFIIDEILNNPLTKKYFYFINENAGITNQNNLDYSALDEGNQDNLEIINFKRYDTEIFIKYLLVCCKALQQEIKEIKQNEI